MGTLLNADNRAITLSSTTLVGRAATCGLVLPVPRVSSQHAMVFHDGTGWFVRDLGSRNGTWIDDRRLAAGERAALVEGATVIFADERWTLSDAGLPRARAVRDGARRDAEGEILVLPDEDDPQVTVFRDGSGQWWIEDGGGRHAATDGATVTVAGVEWRLALPAEMNAAGLSTTIGTQRMPDTLDAVERFALTVSRDEESVEAVLHFVHMQRALPPRSFHYLCVILARARLADLAEGEIASEAGWRYADDVARDLGVDTYRLNVEVYRLRKQLGKLGLRDAAGIIERRPQSKQLRIGIERVVVQ